MANDRQLGDLPWGKRVWYDHELWMITDFKNETQDVILCVNLSTGLTRWLGEKTWVVVPEI